MYIIISGTNRPNSRTSLVSQHVKELLSELTDEPVELYDLQDMPTEVLHNDMYGESGMPSAMEKIQDEMIIPAKKWIIVAPEYNGSFPGVLKLFIDVLCTRRYAENFRGKQGALIGVAAGRAGNLRGLEHLTGLLNYLGMHVFPNKLPISSIEAQIEEGKLNEATLNAIKDQLTSFVQASAHV